MDILEIQPLKQEADHHEIIKILAFLTIPSILLSIILGLCFETIGYLSGGILGLVIGSIIIKVR